jgi:hypothetical protein
MIRRSAAVTKSIPAAYGTSFHAMIENPASEGLSDIVMSTARRMRSLPPRGKSSRTKMIRDVASTMVCDNVKRLGREPFSVVRYTQDVNMVV